MQEIINLQAQKQAEYLQSKEFSDFLGEKVKRNINEIVSNFLDYGDGNKLLKENIQESLKIPLQSWKFSESDLIDLIGNIFKSKLESLNLDERIEKISKGLRKKFKLIDKKEFSLQDIIELLKELNCYKEQIESYDDIEFTVDYDRKFPKLSIEFEGKGYHITLYKDEKSNDIYQILSIEYDKKKVIPLLDKLGYIDDILALLINLYLSDIKIISENLESDYNNLDLSLSNDDY